MEVFFFGLGSCANDTTTLLSILIPLHRDFLRQDDVFNGTSARVSTRIAWKKLSFASLVVNVKRISTVNGHSLIFGSLNVQRKEGNFDSPRDSKGER